MGCRDRDVQWAIVNKSLEQSRTEKTRARSINFHSHLYSGDKAIEIDNTLQRGNINLE